MKGRKPGPSRFRKAFLAATALVGLTTGSVTLDNLPKDPATDTQSIVTFNIGTPEQHGYNISPLDQFWKHSLVFKSPEQMNADLIAAAAEADSWRVRALIERGVELSKTAQQALAVGAAGGHDDVVKALLGAGVAPAAESLVAAAEGNHTQIALALLRAGADAAAQDSEALISAAANGNTALVRALLDAGAQADAQGNAALAAAVQGGHAAAVDALLSAQKTVFIASAPPPVWDFDGLGGLRGDGNPFDAHIGPFSPWSPAGMSDGFGPPPFSAFGMGEVKRLPVVDVNAGNAQALFDAVYNNDTATARVLMAHGANADARGGEIKRLANESRNTQMVNILNGPGPAPGAPPFGF